MDWNTWYKNGSNIKELLSGTLFIRNTVQNKNLVQSWYLESYKNSFWEQKTLQKLIDKYKIKVFNLPLEYCYIMSLPDGQESHIKIENPIISHYQISRKTKRLKV